MSCKWSLRQMDSYEVSHHVLEVDSLTRSTQDASVIIYPSMTPEEPKNVSNVVSVTSVQNPTTTLPSYGENILTLSMEDIQGLFDTSDSSQNIVTSTNKTQSEILSSDSET